MHGVEARGSLAGLEPDEVSGAFGTMLSQPGTMTIWMIVSSFTFVWCMCIRITEGR